MPFDDELHPGGVTVHPYDAQWPAEATALAQVLTTLVPGARAVEHIGSTAVPGMAAKDCLDMMLIVDDLKDSGADPALTAAGYRRRPEPWNNVEEAVDRQWPKLVFAPPPGSRPCNIHIRLRGSGTARLALLFRDHLRANPARTQWWSELKVAAARHTSSLAEYGQLKLPAWRLLMELAESWARDTGWEPTFPREGRRVE